MKAKTEALRWSMLSMRRLGYDRINFECDSKELIKIINGGEDWPMLSSSLSDFIQNKVNRKYLLSSSQEREMKWLIG